MRRIAVIGAGSWGSSLALVLADNQYEVSLWSRRADQVEEINQLHRNAKYLAEIEIPSSVTATTDIVQAIEGVEYILLVMPTKAMREVLQLMKPHLQPEQVIIHSSKGLEPLTFKRISQIIEEEIPEQKRRAVAILSGPSHAEEVSLRTPTTIVAAAKDLSIAEEIQDLFINNYFRVYTSVDVIGVEVGGALKNIIALGAGLSDGLGYGDNAKAALMTRGLAEIVRLGVEMGANPFTFTGLTGIGDLIATCTSKHSRNWRCGYKIGQGEPLEDVLQAMGMVVEGVRTTKAAYQLALERNVSMPITRELYQVLFEDKSPKDAVDDLMGRHRTHELEN